jgi:hypothetical protein
MGAAGSLAVATVVGAPTGTITGTITGNPPVGLLFLAADASAPAVSTACVAGPMDVVVAVGAPTGITAGAAGPWAIAAVIGAPAGTAAGTSPGRPLTRLWVEPRFGRRRTPSSQHPNMAFWCNLPGRPPSTHPWAEPRTSRRCTPSSWHPSMALLCSRWDPPSLCLCHSSHRPRRRGLGSGTYSLTLAASARRRSLPPHP